MFAHDASPARPVFTLDAPSHHLRRPPPAPVSTGFSGDLPPPAVGTLTTNEDRAPGSWTAPVSTPTIMTPGTTLPPLDPEDALILRSLLCLDELKDDVLVVTPRPLLLNDHATLWGAAAAPTRLKIVPRWCLIDGCGRAAKHSGRCRLHGGGRTCEVEGCTKSSQSRGRCIRHGGGKRCAVEGCPRGAQARGKCKAHGGGVRCQVPGCDRSSQGGGLCRTHGGGRLCDFPGCKKGTQRQGKCSAHGGARRCRAAGCTKIDRGGGFCGYHRRTLSPSSLVAMTTTEEEEATAAGIDVMEQVQV